jgi:hypothetical protein
MAARREGPGSRSATGALASQPPGTPKAPAWARLRMAALEGLMRREHRAARRWHVAFYALLSVFVLTAAYAMGSIVATTNTYKQLHGEVHKYDENTFLWGPAAVDVAPISLSLTGGTLGTAVEMLPVLASAATAVGQGDWFYQADLKEKTAGSLGSGTFKVELFVDGVSKGALFVTQGVSVPLSVEGVALKWSLGPTLASYAAYVVKVTQVA